MKGPGRRGRIATVAALAPAAGVLAPVAAAPPATALTEPVGFTADRQPAHQTIGIVWSLTEANGAVHAGGTFSSVRPAGTPAGGGSTPAVNSAVFDAETGAPAGTRSSGTATVPAPAVSPDESTLYVGGYFNAVNGTSADGLVTVDTATRTWRAGFSPNPSATVRALDVASNGTVHTGGDFRSVNGQVLEAARIRFRTSSDPTAGSTDSHSVVPVTGAWTDSTVTYSSRPALAVSVLGTITGATAVSTDHSVELSAPAPGGALRSSYSLALTSSGTDSLRVWSGEAGPAASRPQLVLTFGAE
ncbi:DNRLRE domain-containing protein [Streptomyces anulatus]|uniref:DNRLRE domain-containing protein n=1 Tax=Streptomyces anulatus TaxID=1892 RepID=UPI0004CA498F|nr:DNRLRE domain-containing protein [Streptomyces anulatus]